MTDKKVKCPICRAKVDVVKGEDFPEGKCSQCGHPFRPSELGTVEE